MTETNTGPQQRDIDEAVRKRVIERAKAINTKLLARLGTVSDDLDVGGHRAAFGGLDGLERQIDTMRSLLLLLRRRSTALSQPTHKPKGGSMTHRRNQHPHNQKPQVANPGSKKTPVEVVLEQIGKQEEKVSEMREELAHEERELAKLQQARKVLEAQ